MSSDHYEAAKAAWETAGKIVQGDRRETHGDFKENFEAIAGLWDAYIAAKNYDTGQVRVSLINAEDVAQMMVLLKIARTMNGRLNPDDYVDAIGYATIAAGLATSSG